MGGAALLALALAGQGLSGPIHDRVYQPPSATLVAAALPPGGRLIAVRTADGLNLTGAAIRPHAGQPTVLIFHGNASSAMSGVRLRLIG